MTLQWEHITAATSQLLAPIHPECEQAKY